MVSDGTPPTPELRLAARDFAGLFVGGTNEWKLDSAGEWCDLAGELGKPCHIARMGTGWKVLLARSVGAASIDSTVPLRSDDNLRVFIEALEAPLPRRQNKLWRRVS